MKNSNTTLVKVKFSSADMIYYFKQNSNTTLVKVKWKLPEEEMLKQVFKYNSC